MRATKLKGMKVLDSQGQQIGKISDLNIDLDEFKVKNVIVSKGGFFGKKNFSLNLEYLGEIDNVIRLKYPESDVSLMDIDLKSSMYELYFFKDFKGIYVASADAVSIGPVKDLTIDLDKGFTFKVIIQLGRGKDHFAVSHDDIEDIREFIILKLKKDEIKQRINEFRDMGI